MSAPTQEKFTEADRLLPIHNILRIMRQSLPPKCKVSSEVKERMLESVTEFISFLTNHAVEEHMANDQRKTFTDSDLMKALTDLDFQIFVPPLQAYLSQRQERLTRNTKDQTDKKCEKNDSNSAMIDNDPMPVQEQDSHEMDVET